MGKKRFNKNGIRILKDYKKGLPKGPVLTNPAQIKGNTSEMKFFDAFKFYDYRHPDFFMGVRWSSELEDQEGVDFWVIMKEGIAMPVNVKSSFGGMRAFNKEKHRRPELRLVIPFVVLPHDTNQQIRAKLFSLAQEWREKYLDELTKA